MDAVQPSKEANDTEIVDEEPRGNRVGVRADDPDRAARWMKWQAENAAAIAASNAWVEEHGLPLARYRMF